MINRYQPAAILPPIGCNGRGIQDSSLENPISLVDPPVEEQFRLLRRSNVFDFLDKLPMADQVESYRKNAELHDMPMRTTHWFYQADKEESLMDEHFRRTAELGATTHNVMLYSRYIDGRKLGVDDVVEQYLRAYDSGMKYDVEPSFETHINCWSEDPRLVTPVARKVQSRGVPFNLTLDYSHMIFKMGNRAELEHSGIYNDVERRAVVLDPFENGNLVDEWLDLGIVRWYQMRTSVPNGPRNIWAPHDPEVSIGAVPRPPYFSMEAGDPGRGILYPFTRPQPGEWHSPWHSYLLEPAREVARRVLRHHATNPLSRLRFITTEMITNPDYGLNAKFSLIGQNAAIASFLRKTWKGTVQEYSSDDRDTQS